MDIENLTQANADLTQERDLLSVEIQNMKATETLPDPDGEQDLPPGVSGDAARKRLWRLCKRGADG